jgi:enoyl-CoA hydratase/carnithine racemase
MNDEAAAAVSYEVRDGVAAITIERPEVKNAMNQAVFDGLRARAEQAAGDEDVGAVLLSGRGGTFSSGLDITIFSGGGVLSGDVDQGRAWIANLQASFNAFEDIDKPTVAAIEGHCYGGGIQLAAACHVRAIAPGAKLSVLERRWGLIPDLGGTHRLPRLVGLGRATELVLTARVVETSEALAIGLAEVALGADDPQVEAFEYARVLATGPGAVRRAPRLLRENWDRPRAAALAAEVDVQLTNIAGPDFLEAVQAGMERREPSFVGA